MLFFNSIDYRIFLNYEKHDSQCLHVFSRDFILHSTSRHWIFKFFLVFLGSDFKNYNQKKFKNIDYNFGFLQDFHFFYLWFLRYRTKFDFNNGDSYLLFREFLELTSNFQIKNNYDFSIFMLNHNSFSINYKLNFFKFLLKIMREFLNQYEDIIYRDEYSDSEYTDSEFIKSFGHEYHIVHFKIDIELNLYRLIVLIIDLFQFHIKFIIDNNMNNSEVIFNNYLSNYFFNSINEKKITKSTNFFFKRIFKFYNFFSL